MCISKRFILLTFAIVCAALPAAADSYAVSVNTGSLAGQSGYFDLQLEPGPLHSNPAGAIVTQFITTGTVLGAAALTGDVSGQLPNTLNFDNLTVFNDYFQPIQFGTQIAFRVTLTAPSPLGGDPSAFNIAFYAADGSTALLTASPDGNAGQIIINPDGGTTAVTYPGAAGSVLSLVSSTPEPAHLAWLGLVVFAGFALWRKRGSALTGSVLGTVLAFAILVPAAANATPAAVYSTGYRLQTGLTRILSGGDSFSTQPAAASLSLDNVSGGYSFNSLGSNPSAYASTSDVAQPALCVSCYANDARVRSDVTYYFTIIAPNGSTPAASVPVLATGTSTLSSNFLDASSHASAIASLDSGGADGFTYYLAQCGTDLNYPNGNQTYRAGCGTITFQTSSSDPAFTAAQIAADAALGTDDYSGTLYISATVHGSDGGDFCDPSHPSDSYCFYSGFQTSAYIDPYISIDPAFLAANPGYSLVVSAGVANIPPAAAPEPATWALLCAGGIGLTVSRRRR